MTLTATSSVTFLPEIPAISLIRNFPLQFGMAILVDPLSDTVILSVLCPESKVSIRESGHT